MPRAGMPGRRVPEVEEEVKQWIMTVTGLPWPNRDYADVLRDGVLLCKVMNVLMPGRIKRINTQGGEFRMIDNANNFMQAMLAYGVSDIDLFECPDLVEKKDISAVTRSIMALGRQTYLHPEWKGPYLGPKPAEMHVREFDERTLASGRAVISMQAGSHKGATQSGQNFGAGRKIIIGK